MERRGRRKGPDFRRTVWNVEAQLVARSGKQKLSMAFLAGWHALKCGWIEKEEPVRINQRKKFWKVQHKCNLKAGIWAMEPFLCKDKGKKNEWGGRELGVRVDLCLWAASLQLCLGLCDPVDCNPPGSSVHGHLQASILGWVANPFSRGSPPPKDWTHAPYVACIGRWVLYH